MVLRYVVGKQAAAALTKGTKRSLPLLMKVAHETVVFLTFVRELKTA